MQNAPFLGLLLCLYSIRAPIIDPLCTVYREALIMCCLCCYGIDLGVSIVILNQSEHSISMISTNESGPLCYQGTRLGKYVLAGTSSSGKGIYSQTNGDNYLFYLVSFTTSITGEHLLCQQEF